MTQLRLWLSGAFLLFGLISALADITQVTVPANAPANPIVSSAAEGSHILKAAPGALLSLYVTGGAASGFILIFNSATVPADGVVTPVDCIPIAASGYAFLNYAPQPPEWFSTGISAAYSTTGCFSKTISTGAFFHALVQ